MPSGMNAQRRECPGAARRCPACTAVATFIQPPSTARVMGPAVQVRQVPPLDAPQGRLRRAAQDEDLLAVLVEGASHQRPNLSGAGWDGDLHGAGCPFTRQMPLNETFG